MRLSQEGLFDAPVTNPYFISMAKQVRLCARCGHKTRLAGTLNPDAAYEVCDACGYFFTLTVPEWAEGKGSIHDKMHTLQTMQGSRPKFEVIDGGID